MTREEFEPVQNLPFNSQVEVYTNARIKEYPHIIEEQVCTHAIFPMGIGNIKPARPYTVPPPGEAKNPMRAEEESRRRAKSKVLDIVRCNHFQYMLTLTIDGNKLDRYDSQKVYQKVRTFLSNATARHGFEYVMVPEYHKRKPGEERPAIHLHGLCNLGSLEIVPAVNPRTGKALTEKGKPVYNLPAWIWGFSKLVPLDENSERAALYITKYITKSEDKIFGKRYLLSRKLTKAPQIIPLAPINYSEFRDEAKLALGQQIECNLYGDTYMVTEVLGKPGE